MNRLNDVSASEGPDVGPREPRSWETKAAAGVCLLLLAIGGGLLFDLARWVGYPWFLAWMPAAIMVCGAIVGSCFLSHPSRAVRTAAGRLYWVAVAMCVVGWATLPIQEWSGGWLLVSLVCAGGTLLVLALAYRLRLKMRPPAT